jgi:hypothetical protein
MKFETARVRVLRRSVVPPADLIESNPFEDPEFTFEVIAWPPGEIDGGLLPHNGDQITLPGHETPFRVCDRTLHWPPPTSAEARRGEVRVDLIVEPMPDSPVKSPFGRPGEDAIRANGRWLEGEVVYFESRKTYSQHDLIPIHFRIDGMGTFSWNVLRNFQVAQMFPDMTGLNSGTDDGFAVPAEVFARLSLGQRFEVLVGPGRIAGLEIREVRPLPEPDLEDEPSRRAEQAAAPNEVRGGEV